MACADSAASNRMVVPAGFTLVEVMVAIVLSVVVLLAARMAADQLGMGAERIGEQARAADRERNAGRFLRALVANFEVSARDSAYFEGNAQGARFTSWCPVAGGWLVRCGVQLAIEPVAESARIVAHLTTGESLVFAHDGRPVGFRYLSDARDGGHWLVQVGAGLVPPLGIGVIFTMNDTRSDTLFFKLGERG